MARFVAQGFLQLDGVVPEELNAEALEALPAGIPRAAHGVRVDEAFPSGSLARRLLAVAPVAGALHSLVGPEPTYDFSTVIIRPPHQERAQLLHSDVLVDVRTDAFDVTLMYFPHEVTLAMGGTLLIPGSHLRRTIETDIGRYQNLRGQHRMTCPAGTVLLLHHGIWHGGRRNDSDLPRYMFKIRFNPTVRQLRLWNTDDLHDPAVAAELRTHYPWYEGSAGKMELYNRVMLWRALTGDDSFDPDYWVTRVSNRPQRVVVTTAG
ncbi:phytanoyl-CoA dioxygenase family protein [Kitasatospora viridis]|nr:phytanoyl-CoA dioxygenase family protein [Kitasatospora viridis]